MTKLTLEIHYPKHGKRTYTSESDAWDSSIEDLCEMFCGLLKSAGFQVESVGEVFDE